MVLCGQQRLTVDLSVLTYSGGLDLRGGWGSIWHSGSIRPGDVDPTLPVRITQGSCYHLADGGGGHGKTEKSQAYPGIGLHEQRGVESSSCEILLISDKCLRFFKAREGSGL